MSKYAWVGDWRYVTREDAQLVAEANARAIKAEYGFTDLVAVVQEWMDFPLPKFTAIVRTEQMDKAVGR